MTIRVTVIKFHRDGSEEQVHDVDADEMELDSDSEGTPVLVLHRLGTGVVAMFTQWARAEKITFNAPNSDGVTVMSDVGVSDG